MQINFITFSSLLHKTDIVLSHKEIIDELNKFFTLKFYKPNEIDKLTDKDFTVVFIGTGGVEHLVISQFEKLPRPLIILADNYENSLPAALEISSWVRHQGVKCELLYGKKETVVQRLQIMADCFMAQHALFGLKIGVIGTPSPWLVSSGVDYLLTKRRWGIEFIDITLDEVYKRYNSISGNDVHPEVENIISRATQCRDCSPEEIVKAMRLYKAIKMVCDDFHLNALTLSCFKILEKLNVSGCLALSLLNDDGIIAGCEGDLQSIFTMVTSKTITGCDCFMANISRIMPDVNEVVFAHCTVGTKMADTFCLRTHYESNKSIGIQGILPMGVITAVRCGGECLDEFYAASGDIIENTEYTHSCRTQIRVKMHSSVDYFLNNPLGNHHIVMAGNQVELLKKFFEINTCKRVE